MKFFLSLYFLFSFAILQANNFEKGKLAFEQDKMEIAKNYFEQYLKQNPEHTKTLEYLGDIAGSQKKWEEALKYYKKIKEKFPNNADYQYKYGGALGMIAKESNKFKALGMLDEVEASFLSATTLDQNHIGSRWALVMLYLELPAIIGGSEKKAQNFASELASISQVEGYLSKGYIDVYFKRYSQATHWYEKAHAVANTKDTYEKLYDLYLNKINNKTKAEALKTAFYKK
jgi:tetratricopeptide (TPR) repeat protein